MTFQPGADEEIKKRFHFWTPGPESGVRVGPEKAFFPLPSRPLPIPLDDWDGGEPSDDAVGRGIFDFLRLAPDHPEAPFLAGLLRDAFPHYLAEIGSQVLMIDAKDVDAAFIKRKIVGLKILLLLVPDNANLCFQLGKNLYDLAMSFSELPDCRRHLLMATRYLDRAARLGGDAVAALNLLGRADFMLGDYPAAERRWKMACDASADEKVQKGFQGMLGRIREGKVPGQPLIDELESIGTAMRLIAENRYRDALDILEEIEETGSFMEECPNAEFPFLLGLCRGKCENPSGALEAFDKALQLDPENEAARSEKDRVLDGRS